MTCVEALSWVDAPRRDLLLSARRIAQPERSVYHITCAEAVAATRLCHLDPLPTSLGRRSVYPYAGGGANPGEADVFRVVDRVPGARDSSPMEYPSRGRGVAAIHQRKIRATKVPDQALDAEDHVQERAVQSHQEHDRHVQQRHVVVRRASDAHQEPCEGLGGEQDQRDGLAPLGVLDEELEEPETHDERSCHPGEREGVDLPASTAPPWIIVHTL